MTKFKEELKKLGSRKSARVSGGVVVMILLVWIIIRSCTGSVLLDRHSFVIARDPTGYPFELQGKEKNMLAFTNELFNGIAKKMHISLVLVAVRNDELFRGLDNESYDAVISDLRPNSINMGRYEFSDPIFLTGPVLVVPDDSTIKDIEEMEGRIVGIKSGSFAVYRIPQYPAVLFTTYGNMRVAIDDLIADKIDGVILEALPAYIFAEGYYTGQIKVVGHPLTDEGARLVSLKDPHSVKLISLFNEGLKQMIENGTYEELIKKWGLFDTLEKEK